MYTHLAGKKKLGHEKKREKRMRLLHGNVHVLLVRRHGSTNQRNCQVTCNIFLGTNF